MVSYGWVYVATLLVSQCLVLAFHFTNIKSNSSRKRVSTLHATIGDDSLFTITKVNGDNAQLEAIFCEASHPETSQKLAPILFIHGSFHSGWCWQENFMSYFASRGHPSCSISLRGTSSSIYERNSNTVQIYDHIADLKQVLIEVKTKYADRDNPVIISHSFGGLITMKLLEDESIRNHVSGAALLCSVPPSGNGPMTKRFLASRFVASLKIVYGFVLKAATRDLQIARELFFDSSVSDADIRSYMVKFKADSEVGLDVTSLGPYLPSVTSTDGRARWLSPDSDGVSVPNNIQLPRRLVLGAEKDYIVDTEGVEETARYFGVSPVILPGAYHDVMLGPSWIRTATILLEWLQNE